MALTYLDFELEISSGVDRDYPVAVIHSPAGETRTTLTWPFGELQLENRLKDLQIALLSSGGTRRQILSPAEQAVQNFGRELFDWLFAGEVRNRYDVSQERARQQGKGLRVKLRIHAPALAALPWEYLYDGRAAEYLCLSRSTPVVRYLELPHAIQPLAVTPPLQILGMIASPTDLQPLDVEVEKARIAHAIADLEAQGLVQWTWLPGQTWRDLQRALRRGPWHVFHFIGHGMFDALRDEGLVALADAQGKAHLFSATDLSRLLADHAELRLVLLNSCEGAQGGVRDIFAGTAATLVRRGLPAVVAMQYAITDRAAIEFAQMFYESLADGLPIDAAVSEARKAISVGLANSLEWGTPVLHLRAADGVLFAVGEGIQRKVAEEQRGRGGGKETGDKAIGNRGARGEEDKEKVQPEPVDQRTVEPTPPAARTPATPSDKPVTPPVVIVRPPIEFDWVTIPAGEFGMGSDKQKDRDDQDNELPQHRLFLPEYRIARGPVTVAQFAQFVAATNYKTTAEVQGSAWGWNGKQWANIEGVNWAHPRGPKSDVEQKENHPVTAVSWHDAVAFCAWATAEYAKAGQNLNIRLPTEAEWEKAARGTDVRLYPWGNEAPDAKRCNFDMNIKDTTPVGQYPKGVYDLVDMAGNVWEWTNSKYKGYPYAAEDGREDAAGGDGRVLRGGAFISNRNKVRCAARDFNDPVYRSYNLGFRVVAPVSGVLASGQ